MPCGARAVLQDGRPAAAKPCRVLRSVSRTRFAPASEVAPTKVLAIMGSPRKGDTCFLTPRVEEKMRGVVFASPLHAPDMTAHLKKLLDHLAHHMHRPCFFDQKVLLVCTAGTMGVGIALRTMPAVGVMGFTVAHKLGMLMQSEQRTHAEERLTERKTERAAEAFHRALQAQRRPSPSLMALSPFRAQQVFLKLNCEEVPADHQYFADQGWFAPGRGYYVDAPVKPLTHQVARFVGRVSAWQTRRRLATPARVASGMSGPPQ